MKIRKHFSRMIVVILPLALLVGVWPGSAQDEAQILPERVLSLEFSAGPTEPPIIEEAPDTFVFKVNPVGTVTSALEGTFAQRVTQVHPFVLEPTNAINQQFPITTFFTIETDEGAIEGYYAGAFYFPEAVHPDASVQQYGQVLSVTATYADLYLAEVFYEGIVDFEEVDGMMIGLGDSGMLTIAPR